MKGLCKCGCGEKTWIATPTFKAMSPLPVLDVPDFDFPKWAERPRVFNWRFHA